MTPTPKSEPVLTATLLAPGVVFLATYFGFQVDLLLATQIAGGALAVGSVVARRYVTPVAKVQNDATPAPTTYFQDPAAKPAMRKSPPPFDPP